MLIESKMSDGLKSSVTKLWDFHILVNAGGRERTYAQFQRLVESSRLRLIDAKRVSLVHSLVERKRADNDYA